jgi:hypothetical protein
MLKVSTKVFALVIIVTAAVFIFLQSSLVAQPVRSPIADTPKLNQPIIVATAVGPPQITTAVLGGKPVHVLYVTQSTDTVLVRCYPGYEPTIAVRAMGKNPQANTQKEGVMTCRAGA